MLWHDIYSIVDVERILFFPLIQLPTTMESSLPATMQAQFLEEYKKPYKLRSVPLPKPSTPHDILIKVDAASYCHTDFVLAEGQMPGLPKSFPHIGCHEFAGTVVSHFESPSKEASEFSFGARVGVPGRAFHPCGECFECRQDRPKDLVAEDQEGYSVHCVAADNLGLSRGGGFSEYALVDARQLAPIPEKMTAVQAAPLMCAGITIYAALKRCGLQQGGRVGILGAGGGLGHLGLQYAVHMGYKVVGVEAADAPLGLANDVAANLEPRPWIVDARSEETASIVKKLGAEDKKTDIGEMGLDAVVVLPESQAAFDYGMRLLKTHGTCVVVSFPESGFHISAHDIVFRDIKIIGSLVGSNRTLREMLEFSAKHSIGAVYRTYSLSDLNALVDEYHEGKGGKLIVDLSKK
jgi:D-arabinose 1-dehydrogenase-like Zn-dependent alcohol dehydrogenase